MPRSSASQSAPASRRWRTDSVALWIVRGFGTALMHGSVSAMMAIISKQLVDTRGGPHPWVFLPGLALATILHSGFNHFFVAPNVTTVLILVVLPFFFVTVFHFSESRTREWLGTGFDTDSELLEMISAGRASDGRIGGYLEELRERFPPPTAVDPRQGNTARPSGRLRGAARPRHGGAVCRAPLSRGQHRQDRPAGDVSPLPLLRPRPVAVPHDRETLER